MKEIEVILSMALFHHRVVRKNSIAVVVDILRATTSIVSALDYGVKSIIPVSSKAEAEVMKYEGYLLAAEENGQKLTFADFGKSADHLRNDLVIGKEIVYSTNNGTKAFRLTREEADKVVVGAFPNLSSLAYYLSDQDKNIVIVCCGNNNLVSLEDQLFAGALSQKLMDTGLFSSMCDSLTASIDLWNLAKTDVQAYVHKVTHRRKHPYSLSKEALDYTFTIDSSHTIPILHFNHIKAIKYHK